MRLIDDRAIQAHADQRFRSEYDYALFEYYRSAKVFAFLDRARVPTGGRVLDAGCGGGGMPVSLAEEARHVVGIDLVDRFRDAGVRLARERRMENLSFVCADGMALPFRDESFDVILSHAVIEHVADAPLYLRECARVLAPGGWMYLSTAPYLSFAGAHLPRLKVPVPLHLIVGRRAAFEAFLWLARHAPSALREPAEENSFIKAARRGERKVDDLLEKVRVRRLRTQMNAAGWDVVLEELTPTGTFKRWPAPIVRWLRESALTQDVIISAMQYVLRKRDRGPG